MSNQEFFKDEEELKELLTKLIKAYRTEPDLWFPEQFNGPTVAAVTDEILNHYRKAKLGVALRATNSTPAG